VLFFPYIIGDMELHIGEISNRLSTKESIVTSDAARKRLERHGYKPCRYIGANSMFELSDDDIEYLKQCDKRGRPPSDSKQKNKPKNKAKKNK